MRHAIAILVVVLLAPAAQAATLPSGFSETIISGLVTPTAMAQAPDGRIFVCEQGGALRVIKNGALLAAPFVTLTVDSSGERGLLGVAFDHDFLNNHYVYVYYTVNPAPKHNRISRFTANGDLAAPASEVVLLDLTNLSGATNHNGGAIHFGSDGKLYAAAGENANGANSQTFSNLLGKVLRMNSDGTIPSDNPYFNDASVTGNNKLIWALGLRNPYTFAFHPISGRMFINDIGQNTYEEINDGIAQSNYGWPDEEGPPATTPDPQFTYPLHYYTHAGPPGGCAITGGTFYAPEVRQFPSSYVESYFFSDLCGRWIYRLPQANPPAVSFATGVGTAFNGAVDQLVGHDGSLYYLGHNGVAVRVRWDASLKGDVDGDGATTNLDVFYFINYLYGGGPAPAQGGDVDGNGLVNADDLTYLVAYLYGRGPTPA